MHIDPVRLPEALMDPRDQADPVFVIGFRHQLAGLFLAAVQLLHHLLPPEIDVNFSFVVDPSVPDREVHPVKEDSVKKLRVC